MENKLELSLKQNHKGNWSSLGGDRIPPTSVVANMGDCGETAVKQDQTPRSMDVPTSSCSSNVDPMITREKKKMFCADERDKKLLLPNLSWDEKALFILNMVRLREIKPTYYDKPTRFCDYNIALFDLDKESVFKREPRFSKVPDNYEGLAPSINIFSIKVVQSDVRYPIDIYGTVLARDMIDYRCVYLFKRDRDNPQRVTTKDGNLTLTGPSRALAAIDVIYIEFNLKIKCKDGADQDFSKCMTVINSVCAPGMHPVTRLLESCLSKVQLEFAHVFRALEASIEISVLTEDESCFQGKITAGEHKNGIVLYDSKVSGTKTSLGHDGSVSLTRRVVSIPWCGYLGLNFSVPGVKRKFIRFDRGDEEGTLDLGMYELRVKITWMGVFCKHSFKVLRKIGRGSALMEPSFNVIY